MQTTLRVDDATYRDAKSEAARLGMTLTRFIDEALRQKIDSTRGMGAKDLELQAEIQERNRMMEALLERTARFLVGEHPTREEMNAR